MPLVCRGGPARSSRPPAPVGKPRHRCLPAVVAAVLVIAVGACTEPTPVPAPPSNTPAVTATRAPQPASELTVSLDADGLSPTDKAALAKVIGSLVGAWLDAAYLSGPVGDRPGSRRFPGFTDGAARSAAQHPRQLTNAALGPKAKGLVATARTVKAGAYVAGHKAHGVVADVAMTASGPRAKLTVRGSLDLTRAGGRWRIFGYRITVTTP